MVAGTAWKVGNSEYTCMCLSRTFGTLNMSRSMKAMLRASDSLPHKRQACRQIKLTQIGKLKSKETVEPRGVPKDSEVCMVVQVVKTHLKSSFKAMSRHHRRKLRPQSLFTQSALRPQDVSTICIFELISVVGREKKFRSELV